MNCRGKIIEMDNNTIKYFPFIENILKRQDNFEAENVIIKINIDPIIMSELLNFYTMPRYFINIKYLRNTKELAKYMGNEILSTQVYEYVSGENDRKTIHKEKNLRESKNQLERDIAGCMEYLNKIDKKIINDYGCSQLCSKHCRLEDINIKIENVYMIKEFRLTYHDLFDKNREKKYGHNTFPLITIQVNEIKNKYVFDDLSNITNEKHYSINNESLINLNQCLYNDTINFTIGSEESLNYYLCKHVYILYEKNII
jgi:hypothetical protein